MMQDDVVIVNGCCIRLPEDFRMSMLIRHSGGNTVEFQVFGRMIDITGIKYSSVDTLSIMLEALSRYACSINADGITCSSKIPLDTIAFVDASGILDRSYS